MYRPLCQIQQKPNQLSTELVRLNASIHESNKKVSDIEDNLVEKDNSLKKEISDIEDNLIETFCLGHGWFGKVGIGCFYFEETMMSWQKARNHCKSMNDMADLAEIHSAEANDFLQIIMIEKSFDYCWIGLSDEEEVNHI